MSLYFEEVVKCFKANSNNPSFKTIFTPFSLLYIQFSLTLYYFFLVILYSLLSLYFIFTFFSLLCFAFFFARKNDTEKRTPNLHFKSSEPYVKESGVAM